MNLFGIVVFSTTKKIPRESSTSRTKRAWARLENSRKNTQVRRNLQAHHACHVGCPGHPRHACHVRCPMHPRHAWGCHASTLARSTTPHCIAMPHDGDPRPSSPRRSLATHVGERRSPVTAPYQRPSQGHLAGVLVVRAMHGPCGGVPPCHEPGPLKSHVWFW